MFCCFGGGVRKKKKEKSQRQIQQPHNNKDPQKNQSKLNTPLNKSDIDKTKVTNSKYQLPQDQNDTRLKQPDSKIASTTQKNGKGKEILQKNDDEFKQLKSNEIKSQNVKEVRTENSLLVKQNNHRVSSLVVQKQKGEDYGIENNETNAIDLKAQSKTLQLRFYDEGSIIQTPAISTFRYDTFLSHYFGEQQHHDVLSAG